MPDDPLEPAEPDPFEPPDEPGFFLLVDPEDGSDLMFELLTSHMSLERDTSAIVSVLRNVTDLGRARQELEDNYRRLIEAEAQMRTERNRLDLLVGGAG